MGLERSHRRLGRERLRPGKSNYSVALSARSLLVLPSHPLAGYYQALHESIIAHSGKEQPRVVLLSPGPTHEGYFANAYFARYLGYTHVEGADLTVRDKRVYLKTLDGLQQVDVILRRIGGIDCDPVELNPYSGIGIAILVQAVRAGNVVIMNALGSGLLECEGYKGFLPGLCQHLLGEDLLLPSNATWWCSQADARDYVVDNLEHLVVRPAFKRSSYGAEPNASIVGESLDAPAKAALIERLRTRGYQYVGQELVSLSTAPVLSEGRLRPGSMILRMLVVANGDSYMVMPGGLTRITETTDSRDLALHEGVGSKDTWVLSEQPARMTGPLSSRLGAVHLRRTGKDLPSHSADNLFWLGRYAERAEGTTRDLRSVLTRFAEDGWSGPDSGAVEQVLKLLMKRGKVAAATDEELAIGPEAALERQISTLMFDPSCPYGLRQSINHLQRTATLVRDRLSQDAWRTLQQFRKSGVGHRRRVGLLGGRLELGDVLDLLNDAVRMMAAFSGMELENMTRSHSWRFVDMGRRIERALHMVRLSRALLARGDPEENGGLSLVLEIADSFMTYRSRYMITPLLVPVIDLLLMDENNPRSVGFQIAALANHIERLPRDPDMPVRGEDQRIIMALLTNLRLADIHALARTGEGQRREDLDKLLENIAESLPDLSEVIARIYFSHAEQRRAPDVLPRETVT